MTKLIQASALVCALLVLPAVSSASSDFKGEASGADIAVGGMAGFGQVYSEFGFALIGSVSKSIAQQGFVPDINDQVSVEVQAGPLLINGSTLAVYSAHLRWDFIKDPTWTLYAIGGAAGSVGKLAEGGQSDFVMHPRFATGAFLKLAPLIALRGELSAEWTTIGVSFGI